MTYPMFPDAASMKESVKEGLCVHQYSVEDLYHETGSAQMFARSSWFKNTAFLVIALNTVWLALDTDYNIANDIDVLSQAEWQVQLVENLFCLFFVFEISIRFMAFKFKCRNVMQGCAFGDASFCFDFALVSLMVWETWVLVLLFKLMGGQERNTSGSSVFRIFRLFRLTRVARLARLLQGMPELMVLIRGMIIAMRSVFSTMILLLIIVYVFAILFTQMLAKEEAGKDCFETVASAINCLMLSGIFADQKDFMMKMLSAGWGYFAAIYLYMVIAVLTVLNMLIGVICEVVSVVAQAENEESKLSEVKEKLLDLLPQLDADGDQLVSFEEFRHLIDSKDALRVLCDVGVDPCALIDFSEAIFDGRDELTYHEFMGAVFKFRDSNTATLKDMADMRKYVSKRFHRLEVKVQRAGAIKEA